MAKYLVLRCTHCGKLGIYSFGIASKCKHCEKRYDLKNATTVWKCSTPTEASYVLRRLVEEAEKLERATANFNREAANRLRVQIAKRC